METRFPLDRLSKTELSKKYEEVIQEFIDENLKLKHLVTRFEIYADKVSGQRDFLRLRALAKTWDRIDRFISKLEDPVHGFGTKEHPHPLAALILVQKFVKEEREELWKQAEDEPYPPIRKVDHTMGVGNRNCNWKKNAEEKTN